MEELHQLNINEHLLSRSASTWADSLIGGIKTVKISGYGLCCKGSVMQNRSDPSWTRVARWLTATIWRYTLLKHTMHTQHISKFYKPIRHFPGLFKYLFFLEVSSKPLWFFCLTCTTFVTTCKHYLMYWDMRSHDSCFEVISAGMWSDVTWCVLTKVSEQLAAPIFR
jgi:hypothetical protein